MSKMRKELRTTGPSYLDMPVPIRAVVGGQPIRVVNVGIDGCGFEFGPCGVGLLDIHELTDFEPLTLWLDAVERRARRTRGRVKLPYPIACECRDDRPDLVSLTAVGPDGVWSGYDEAGEPVHVRLAEVRVEARTEEYLGEIRELTHVWDERWARRATPCTRA